MKIYNIQNQNFQGKAIYIRDEYTSYQANKEIEKAVKQLNRMNIIKNNGFNIFIKRHGDSFMVTAAKTKHNAEKYGLKYKSSKATSMNATAYHESIVGTAKSVALSHRQKLVQQQEEIKKNKQAFLQKIKNLFTKNKHENLKNYEERT